jgi:hypothetical protein
LAVDLGIYSIAVTLIAIMLSIAGFVLGIGYVTDDKRLKEFGKSEIIQSIINGVIVGTLIIAFSTGGFFAILLNNIAGSSSLTATCAESMSGNYAICFAYNYLVGVQPVKIDNTTLPTLIDTSVGLLVPVSVLYTGLGLLSSISLNLGIVSIGFSSALTPLLSGLKYILEILTAAIIGIEVQGILLKFISITAIPVLLPVGIVLRTVYITRRLGGAIMAVAIGLFAVFPITYVLSAGLSSNYISSIDNGSINTLISTEISTNSGIIASAAHVKLSNNTSGIVSYFVGAINSLLQGFEGLVNQLESIVALIVIEVFFLPVFSIIITIISIREFAKILGSEITFGGLFRW